MWIGFLTWLGLCSSLLCSCKHSDVNITDFIGVMLVLRVYSHHFMSKWIPRKALTLGWTLDCQSTTEACQTCRMWMPESSHFLGAEHQLKCEKALLLLLLLSRKRTDTVSSRQQETDPDCAQLKVQRRHLCSDTGSSLIDLCWDHFPPCEEFERWGRVKAKHQGLILFPGSQPPVAAGGRFFLMLHQTLGFSQTLAGWFLLNLKDVCWCIINSTCFDMRKLLGSRLSPAVSNADRNIIL